MSGFAGRVTPTDTFCYYDKREYKYTLTGSDYLFQTELYPEAAVVTPFIELYADGRLVTKVGYTWDGPSGPTIDTPSFMRASLAHDALYQLMRLEKLPATSKNRRDADRLFLRILREDGMFVLRRWLSYLAVRIFGKPYTQPGAQVRKEKICLRDGMVVRGDRS